MSTVLVVVAHPDDECFMGGTIARFAAEGHAVHVLALGDGVSSREGWSQVDLDARMERHICAVWKLGAGFTSADVRYADQRLDTVPLLDLTRAIESAVQAIKPMTVFTHSPGDLNADHRRVYEAVLPAVRPKNGVKAVYSFAGPRMTRFDPTAYWDVTGHLDRQLAAMACYGEELAGEVELVKARAVDYGYRVGVPYAEGFEVVRERR